MTNSAPAFTSRPTRIRPRVNSKLYAERFCSSERGTTPSQFDPSLLEKIGSAPFVAAKRAATVSGRLQRRVARPATRWALVRRFAARRYRAGPHVLELGRHAAGVYRVTLTFAAASRAPLVRAISFRAGCTNPPPPETTPTLPTGTEPRQ